MREQVEMLEHHAHLAADLLDLFHVAAEFLTSTTIRPRWNSSSRLMQRMAVDLPEPDGPQNHDAFALCGRSN